jgi:hypothetical protein
LASAGKLAQVSASGSFARISFCMRLAHAVRFSCPKGWTRERSTRSATVSARTSTMTRIGISRQPNRFGR